MKDGQKTNDIRYSEEIGIIGEIRKLYFEPVNRQNAREFSQKLALLERTLRQYQIIQIEAAEFQLAAEREKLRLVESPTKTFH